MNLSDKYTNITILLIKLLYSLKIIQNKNCIKRIHRKRDSCKFSGFDLENFAI